MMRTCLSIELLPISTLLRILLNGNSLGLSIMQSHTGLLHRLRLERLMLRVIPIHILNPIYHSAHHKRAI